jgi:sec-independent protein translocase protein TatC
MSAAPAMRPFAEHLRELRLRLITTLLCLIVGTVLGYSFHDQLLAVLVRPLNQPLFYTSPAGGFDLRIQVSLLFGLALAIPVTTYQLVRFVEPVLPKAALRQTLAVMLGSCTLLTAGVAFAYFVSLPAALHFLGSFTNEGVQPLIAADTYVSFVMRCLVGFGLMCQLPLLLLITNAIHPLTTQSLMRYQKWVILASLMFAAVLTPTPDVFNQLLMALPLIGLYQFTVALLWLVNRRGRPNPVDVV